MSRQTYGLSLPIYGDGTNIPAMSSLRPMPWVIVVVIVWLVVAAVALILLHGARRGDATARGLRGSDEPEDR